MSVQVRQLSRPAGDPAEATGRNARTQAAEGKAFFVKLRSDLQTNDVVSIVHYVTDFGTGDARGLALDGGWSIRLSEISDLRLLAFQFPELIDGHSTE